MKTVDDLCLLIQDNVQDPHTTEIRPDTPLLLSGLVDSLSVMRIVAQIERDTGLAIPETVMTAANFKTPHALWTAIEGLHDDQEG